MKPLQKTSLLLLLLIMTFSAYSQTSKNKDCGRLNRPIVTLGSCQGDSILLDAGNFLGATYSWDFEGDGELDVVNSDKFSINHSFETAGIYNPKVYIYTDSCTNGQVNTTNGDLDIIKLDQPTIGFHSQSCEKTNFFTNIDGVDSIVWKMSDGFVYRGDSGIHSFDASLGSSFEVSVSAYAKGCVSKARDIFHFEQLKANPIITADQNCAPAIISLKNEKAYDAEFLWTINDIPFSQKSDFVINATKDSIYQIDLALKNKFGCESKTAKSLEIQIFPELSLSTELSNLIICEESEIALNETGFGYDWRLINWGDGSSDSLLRKTSHQYDRAGEYSITITAKNILAGCTENQTLSPLVVESNDQAKFELNIEGNCSPQLLSVKNNSTTQMGDYILTVNAYDTIKFEEAYLLYELGKNEIRLETSSKSGLCNSTSTEVVDLVPGLNKNISVSILESSTDSSNFSFNWSALDNSRAYEIYEVIDEQFIFLNSIEDTFYNTNNAYDPGKSYRVKAIDHCENSSDFSGSIQALSLKGHYQVDSFPTLQWNEYTAWNQQETEYQIERKMEKGWEIIGTTFKPHFIDREFDNNEVLNSAYRIKALHEDGHYESLSNSFVFDYQPQVFMPNAFSPNHDNVNDFYEIQGHGILELNMKIFNEWGQLVFESSENQAAWDGYYNNELVEPGVFICVAEMQSPNGGTYNFQQSVTVIR